MLANNTSLAISLLVVGSLLGQFAGSHQTSSHEDVDAKFHEGADFHEHEPAHQGGQGDKDRNGQMPKDKVLLSEVKSLTFQRNKRTTSRRTHSIPQLSCVGGTAGCKLFVADLVECENVGTPGKKTRHANEIVWRCRADLSDRVRFNHVEVICEGYDYPEDDYILLGSCGLEFTLDYADPSDYHDKSYFKHMDEHEKKLHQERSRQKPTGNSGHSQQDSSPSASSALLTTEDSRLLGLLILLVAMTLIFLVRYCVSPSDVSKARPGPGGGKQQASKKPSLRSYGPLTSAVMTTKKAC